MQAYSHFLEDSVANTRLDLSNFLYGCRFVKAPNKAIDVTERCKLLVVALPAREDEHTRGPRRGICSQLTEKLS